nr:hypothetical protein [Brevundimonas naejangsanensis]
MKQVSSQVEMNVLGKKVNSSQYGSDYAAEYSRIVNQYIVAPRGRFLEWGAGYTTRILVERIDNLSPELFLTIDSNKSYIDDVVRDIKRPYLIAEAVSMTGPCVDDRDSGLNYSHLPISFGGKFDFIFIDGRRRMECAFVAALLASEDAVIVIHDYRRNRYQTILSLFDVVEDGPQFRVLRVKSEIKNSFSKSLADVQAKVSGT